MIALVFLHSLSQAKLLSQLLKKINIFDTIYQPETLQDCAALAQRFPAAICFLPATPKVELTSSLNWVAVGENESDAMRAFSAAARGFVISPFTIEQIRRVSLRMAKYAEMRDRQLQYQRLLKGLGGQYGINEDALLARLRQQYRNAQVPAVIGFKSESGWCCVPPSDIRWIKASGDYMNVNALTDNIFVRSTLCDLLQRLPSDDFVRCNRSVVVNRDYIERVDKIAEQWRIVMRSGETFKISRRYQSIYWQTFQAPSKG